MIWGARLSFLLGKRFERSNMIGAQAFNEFNWQLALFPIVELIEVFHFAFSLTPGASPCVD